MVDRTIAGLNSRKASGIGIGTGPGTGDQRSSPSTTGFAAVANMNSYSKSFMLTESQLATTSLLSFYLENCNSGTIIKRLSWQEAKDFIAPLSSGELEPGSPLAKLVEMIQSEGIDQS
jgi:hypothetical protein